MNTCKNEVEFFCYEKDEPYCIQLEPEAIVFKVSPTRNLKFIGESSNNDFKWSIRIEHKEQGIQLFPDTLSKYTVQILINNEIIDDWYDKAEK